MKKITWNTINTIGLIVLPIMLAVCIVILVMNVTCGF